MTEKAVLVTGATGFIGRHLVAHLLDQGWRTVALVRDSSRKSVWLGDQRPHLATISDHSSAEHVVRESQPDVIIHLATHFVARHASSEQVQEMVEANVALGAHVAEAAAKAGSPLVTASSVWQHYEGAAYNPVSLYAATKQALDDILNYYNAVEGLGWTRIVLGDTYGPGDDRGKLLNHLLNAALHQRPLEMGSGHQLWEAVHVGDVVRAFELASLEQIDTPRYRQYQLRPKEARTTRDVVRLTESVIGRPVPVEWGARPDRGREMLHPWVVAGPPPGWEPCIEIADGIRRIWRGEYAVQSD